MADNMRYYEQSRAVPSGALKAFSNGRFTGTDINPMWRIKKLTEMFGPAGIGWYTEVTRQEVIPADEGNLMVFVDINLYVREAGGDWSKPIFGTGGNTLKFKGRGDDEGFKKAYTDAMSIACKALGIGADVWYANDTTSKYSDKYIDEPAGSVEGAQNAGQAKLEAIKAQMQAAQAEAKPAAKTAKNGVSRPATAQQLEYIRGNAEASDLAAMKGKYGEELEGMTEAVAEKAIARINEKSNMPTCERCGKVITGAVGNDGKLHTATEIIEMSKTGFGGVFCSKCLGVLSKAKVAG